MSVNADNHAPLPQRKDKHVQLKLVRLIASSLVLASAACGSKPASVPASSGTSAAASGETGVPECDAYIRKYEACISSKVPAQAQASLKASFDAARTTWKQTAANPQARASLATACKQQEDMARQSMQAYGCQW